MTTNSNTSSSTVNGTSSLKDLVLAKKAELEAQLKALDVLDIDTLLREREETAARLIDLDNKIAQVRAQIGMAEKKDGRLRAARAPGSVRARMQSQEIRNRIIKALNDEKFGLSQLQIAEHTAIAYGTVAAYLKANAANFKTTGQLKSKRYFLK